MIRETPHRLLVIRPGAKETVVITGALGPELNKRIIGTEGVDHGGLVGPDAGRGLSIIVAEFGLYEGLDGIYCAIGRNLRSGNIIVYAHEYGETVDISDGEIARVRRNIQWFDSGAAAAAAVVEGVVTRPTFKINGKVVWEWPSKTRPF